MYHFHSQQFFKHTPFMAHVRKPPSLKNVPFSRDAIFQVRTAGAHSAANLLKIAAIQQKRFAKLFYTRLVPRLYNMLRQ
jgi:hypothetical protein